MFSYVVARSFYDFWESFTYALAFNLVALVVVAGLGVIGAIAGSLGSIAAFLAATVALSIGCTAFRIATLRERFRPIAFVRSAAFAAIAASTIALGLFAIYIYGSWNSIGGLALSFAIVWIVVLAYVATYFALPLSVDRSLASAFALSARLFVENPKEVTIAAVIGALLGISSLVLVPGFAGMTAFQYRVLEALERKYAWLEESALSEAPRPFPWKTALAENVANLPAKSLRSLLFPWKD